MSNEANVSEDRSSKVQINEHQANILLSAAGMKPDKLFDRYDVQSPDGDTQESEHTVETEELVDVSTQESGSEDDTEKEKTIPYSLSDADDEGFRHLKIGTIDIRMDADGNPMVKTKVNGEENWIKDDMFLRGYQLNQANNIKAEQLSAKEKELKDLEESLRLGDLIGQRMFPKDDKADKLDEVIDDENDFFPADTGDKRVDVEVKKIRDENLALRNALLEKKKNETLAEKQAEFNSLTDSAHKEMIEWCESKNITPPTPEQLRKDIVVFAENNSSNWQKVASSPINMIKLAKYSLAKSSKSSSIVEAGGKPPKSVPSGGKSTPRLKSADIDDEIKRVRAAAREQGANTAELTASLIALNRERNKIK